MLPTACQPQPTESARIATKARADEWNEVADAVAGLAMKLKLQFEQAAAEPADEVVKPLTERSTRSGAWFTTPRCKKMFGRSLPGFATRSPTPSRTSTCRRCRPPGVAGARPRQAHACRAHHPGRLWRHGPRAHWTRRPELGSHTPGPPSWLNSIPRSPRMQWQSCDVCCPRPTNQCQAKAT